MPEVSEAVSAIDAGALYSAIDNIVRGVVDYIIVFGTYLAPLFFSVYFHFVVGVLRNEIGDVAAFLLIAPALLVLLWITYNYIVLGEVVFGVAFFAVSVIGLVAGLVSPTRDKSVRIGSL